jgi:aspartate/methionine/tyrosine aminotransferase
MHDCSSLIRRPLFSSRTGWDTTESELAKLLADKRKRGEQIYDLTNANPTECSFEYDSNLLIPLQNPEGKHYNSQPQGLMSAREAVLGYYREHKDKFDSKHSLHLDLNQIFLTTSTSEAYSFLFKLLCDPGDEILIAQPSYPLFDFLADLEDVRLVSYPLFYDYGWHLDVYGLREKISPRTRAIVVVNPNNPTGNYTDKQTRQALENLCLEFDLALIVDEVFLDYNLQELQPSFALGDHPALTFVMSGLSKVAGLPQMKLSWICAFGPEENLSQARNRLEVIADTFLSVNTPGQMALPNWLAHRHSIQQQIHRRLRANLATLDGHLGRLKSAERMIVEGGWYAIVRIPALTSGEQAAFNLLSHADVVVHPGAFFGLPEAGWLVLSLLGPTDNFEKGTKKML